MRESDEHHLLEVLLGELPELSPARWSPLDALEDERCADVVLDELAARVLGALWATPRDDEACERLFAALELVVASGGPAVREAVGLGFLARLGDDLGRAEAFLGPQTAGLAEALWTGELDEGPGEWGDRP